MFDRGNFPAAMSGPKESKNSSLTLFVRISADDNVLYANAAFAGYLGVSKELLKGTPLEVLCARLTGEVADCFSRETGVAINRLVTDGSNRVFEARGYTDGLVLDVVLNEVTDPSKTLGSFRGSVGEIPEELSEEETRSFWHPERRILSTSKTRLCGLDEVAGNLPPIEVRLMIHAFVEESSDAIIEAGGSVGDTTADMVEGIFGVPKYYRDHAIRALLSAVSQLEKAAALREGLYKQGNALPPLAMGISTGEVLIASLPCGPGNRFSISGVAASQATLLGRLARPGEILISEPFLENLLSALPEGWGVLYAESEEPADLSDVQWTSEELGSLPENLERRMCLIGPGMDQGADMAEFYFSYLYTVKFRGMDRPVPVLRAVRPETTGTAIELSDDNIVSTPVVQVLGKYKLLAVVGQGGMGKVWRGQDRFGNFVAIKVLSGSETPTEETVKRFQREAEIMARLPHRNICRIFEINTFEGIPFIAMEYVEGITLADLLYEALAEEGSRSEGGDLPWLIRSIQESLSNGKSSAQGAQTPIAQTSKRPDRNRILPMEQTLNLIGKVCDAVQYAHEHGVLHRDLKPGNVLLREDGEPLVADFGLAKASTEDGGESISISGNMLGTLENMAPEQAESSKDVDERADVYSLGTILYQMITGCRHFAATGNIVADAQLLKHHNPIRPRQLNPALDSDLELICLKALRNDPAARYRSVAAMKADLERFKRGEVISARPVTTLELAKKLIQRNRAVTAVAGVSLVLFLLFAAVAFWQINDRRIEAEAAARRAEAETEKADAALLAAERHRMEAEERQQTAEKIQAELAIALVEAKKARDTAKNATRQQRLAVQKTEEADKARTEAEKAREELEKMALTLEDRAGSLEQELAALRESSASETPSSDTMKAREELRMRVEKVRAAKHALIRANMIFANQLTPSELELHARSYSTILTRIHEGLGLAAQALSVDSAHVQALLLKGRYHLALLEFQQAGQAFEKAAASEMLRPGEERQSTGISPSQLLELARAAENTPSQWKGVLFQPLSESASEEDFTTAKLVEYFASNSSIPRVPGAAGSIARGLTPGEVVLALLERNPGPRPVISIEAFPGRPATVFAMEAASLRDLSPLTAIPVEEVSLSGLEVVDWDSLEKLNLKKLVIANSTTGVVPSPSSTGFSQLVEAGFRDSDLSQIGFLRSALSLERLDLANTQVTDLTVIDSRRLRYLDLTGIMPSSLFPLSRFPLEHLVLDTALTLEPTKLHLLKFHRNLRFLRTAADPENQTTREFWSKLDRGEYFDRTSAKPAEAVSAVKEEGAGKDQQPVD